MTLHLLIAPNAFKNSLDARKTSEALGDGFARSGLDCHLTLFPIADGGDGTRALLHDKLGGKLVTLTVSGPLGTPVEASYSLIDNEKTAIIEMADASGVRLLTPEEQNPLYTSSKGTGELILHALSNDRVEQVVLGMGGSATVDGGCGMLHVLGIRFLDNEGKELDPVPKKLQYLKSIDLSGLNERVRDTCITILCDVENKLFGEKGAAYFFGPQKGASAEQVKILDQFLQQLSAVVRQATGKDMAEITSGGTAGGAAAGMYALVNAELTSGIAYFIQKTGFENIIKTADWLLTGEGSLDDQTLWGKAPAGVALLAKKYGIPVAGIAGSVPLEPSEALSNLFNVLIPISHREMELGDAIANTERNLRRTAEAFGNILKYSCYKASRQHD